MLSQEQEVAVDVAALRREESRRRKERKKYKFISTKPKKYSLLMPVSMDEDLRKVEALLQKTRAEVLREAISVFKYMISEGVTKVKLVKPDGTEETVLLK